MPALFTVVEGPFKGRKFQPGKDGEFKLGRVPASCFQIADSADVSREHFMVIVAGVRCRLRDLNSNSGTYIAHAGQSEWYYYGKVPPPNNALPDARHPHECDLNDGDTIRAGRTHIAVHLDKPVRAVTEKIALPKV
jgi:hypothetical protein